MLIPRPIFVFPLATLLLVVGCRPRQSIVEAGIRDQVLHRGGGVEPTTIDPQRNTGAPEANIIECLFDSLVRAVPPEVNEVRPQGAERWTVSPDGLTYDFFLRNDARWSNGEPVVAEDYRAGFLRLIEPALGGLLADFAYPIAGAEDFHRGRTRDAATVGITTEGPHHLRIRLRRPMPHFLHMLETYPFVAVHRPSIEAHGGWLNPASPWTKPGIMVGNGPFRLKHWIPGQAMILERNPYFWDAARVKLREIHFHPIDSIDAEERTFRAGQLHLTYSFPTSRLSTYLADRSPALHVAPRLGMHFLNLNTEKPPLNDPRVRRALACAIDRRQLAEKVLGGGEAPAYSFSQPGMGGYQPQHRLTEGPEEARRLLAAAGFPGGAGFPPLSYLYNTSERNRDVAQALQQMWLRELGIRIELKNEEWKVFLDSRQMGHYEIARAGWLPFTPEPAEFFLLLHSASQTNDSRWRSPAYDRLYDRAASTMDRPARHALYQELDQMILEAMPVVPLAYYSWIRLVDPSVRGWSDNVRDRQIPALLSLAAGAAP